MAGLFDHIGPTAHHAPPEFIPLLPTKTQKNRLLDVHDLVLSATNQRVLSPSLQPKVTPQHSALSPSNQKPPQHSSSI